MEKTRMPEQSSCTTELYFFIKVIWITSITLYNIHLNKTWATKILLIITLPNDVCTTVIWLPWFYYLIYRKIIEIQAACKSLK